MKNFLAQFVLPESFSSSGMNEYNVVIKVTTIRVMEEEKQILLLPTKRLRKTMTIKSKTPWTQQFWTRIPHTFSTLNRLVNERVFHPTVDHS